MRLRHEMPFGTQWESDGRCRFRLWAPAAQQVTLRLRDIAQPMSADGEGWWWCVAEARAGDTYAFRIDDRQEVPDPAARAQARDVHGPSMVVEPCAYRWRDEAWRGRPWEEAVIYELHVGTFTAEGTFAAILPRLDDLAELGVTVLELMPVADFPGERNWGYDGALLFAPERRYGTPADLKALVDAAHARGLMVVLDVVYNHFGPEGNYLHLYAPEFFNPERHTPWGAAINFDGAASRTVRDFFINNALYWLEEYHLDGLRLDAVHAIHDTSRPDLLEELATAVRLQFRERRVHLVLENDNNAARYLGEGRFTAQWNDDFHHCLHVMLTGEADGYYEDYVANPHALLARALGEGFAYQGEASIHRGRRRGERSRHLPLVSFVNFLQNHDQIGNRAFGERLTTLAAEGPLRAATAILLLAPAPPLLFMGQEWGSTRPFPFFCDFGRALAARVTEGRREEFARFADFADPARRALIPDPQAAATADAATLDWSERDTPRARAWLDLHIALLQVRKRHIVPRLAGATGSDARATVIGTRVIAARWRLGDRVLLLLANLGGEPLTGVKVPPEGLIYATPSALGANDTLAGWGVAWFLTEPSMARIGCNGESVLP